MQSCLGVRGLSKVVFLVLAVALSARAGGGLTGTLVDDRGRVLKITSISADGTVKGTESGKAWSATFAEVKQITWDRKARTYTVVDRAGRTHVLEKGALRTSDRTVQLEFEATAEDPSDSGPQSVFGESIRSIEFDAAPGATEEKPADPKDQDPVTPPVAEEPRDPKLSDYSVNQASAHLRKATAEAGDLVARYLKAKADGKLLDQGSSSEFKLQDIQATMNGTLANIWDEVASCLAEGWKPGMKEMKELEEGLLALTAEYTKADYWTCRAAGEMHIPECRRLDGERVNALAASLVATENKDIQGAKERFDAIDVVIKRLLDYSAQKEDDPGSRPDTSLNLAAQPAFKRAVAEIERLKGLCGEALGGLEKAKAEAIAAWTELDKTVKEHCDFFGMARDAAGAQEDAYPELLAKFEAFEKNAMPGLRTMLEAFAAKHGNTPEKLDESLHILLGSEAPNDLWTASTAYRTVDEGIGYVATARKDIAQSLAERVRGELANINDYSEDMRAQVFARSRERLALGVKFDPHNEDLVKGLARIDELAASSQADLEKQMNERTWPGHIEGFAGPGNPDELAKAALEYFHRTCEPNEHAIAVCLQEREWYTFQRNLFGETVQWGLTFWVAVTLDEEKDQDIAHVYSISFLTAIEPGVAKAPPFEWAAYNTSWKMRHSKVPAGE